MVCLDETSKQRIKETRVPIPAKPGRPARHDYEYERVDRRAVPAPMGTANIFIERLWRSLKYEEVFTKAYGSVFGARRGIGGWLSFYDDERPHQAPGYRTPRADFACEACEQVDNTCASLRTAAALPTCSQAQHQEGEEVLMY